MRLGHHVHMECIWFVFASLLQKELDVVKEEWNNHFIRKSKFTKVAGVPDELFYLPETRGFEEKGIKKSKSDVDAVLHDIDVHGEAASLLNAGDEAMFSYFSYVVENEKLDYPPKNWVTAQRLYAIIIERSNC